MGKMEYTFGGDSIQGNAGDAISVYRDRLGQSKVTSFSLPDGSVVASLTVTSTGKVPVFHTDVNDDTLYARVGKKSVQKLQGQPYVAPTVANVPSTVQDRFYLDNVPLWVYGSSFTVEPGFACTAGMEFFKLVKNRLLMGTASTFGASGKSIRDAAKRIVGGLGVANAQWLTTRKGVVIIDTWVNDLAAYSGTATPRAFVAKDITGIKGNLRAALAYMSAGTIIENTSGTKGGTWGADGALNDRSGGSNSVASTAGATMTFTNVSAPEGILYYLCHVLEPNSFSLAPVEVLVDGTVVKTIPATEFQCHANVEGTTSTTGSNAIRIETTPGTHTVVLRHAGSNGQNMLVDALLVPKVVASRTPVFVVQDQMPRGVVGGAFYKPADIPVLQGNWAALKAAYDEVLAEFPNAHLVETTLDNTKHYGADGIHPNDRGMQRKATELVSAMEKYLSTNKPDSLYTTV